MSNRVTQLCGLVAMMTITPAAAQELRDTIGPLEQTAIAITRENPIPRHTRSVTARYPTQARVSGGAATVVFAVTVDEWGCVAEIRRGPTDAADAFVWEAAAALRRWQYERPAQPPMSFSVTFTFKPDAETTATEIAAVVPLAPPPTTPRPPEPVGVGSILMSPRPVKRVEPVYPAQALAAKVEGVVIVEVRTYATGKVAEAMVLRSIPLLDQAALDAVREWVYSPNCFAGRPVPMILTVSLTFALPSTPTRPAR